MAGCCPRLPIILTYNPAEYPKEPANKTHADNFRKFLNDGDWPLFKTLKEWRNTFAKKKGVPPSQATVGKPCRRSAFRLSR